MRRSACSTDRVRYGRFGIGSLGGDRTVIGPQRKLRLFAESRVFGEGSPSQILPVGRRSISAEAAQGASQSIRSSGWTPPCWWGGRSLRMVRGITFTLFFLFFCILGASCSAHNPEWVRGGLEPKEFSSAPLDRSERVSPGNSNEGQIDQSLNLRGLGDLADSRRLPSGDSIVSNQPRPVEPSLRETAPQREQARPIAPRHVGDPRIREIEVREDRVRADRPPRINRPTGPARARYRTRPLPSGSSAPLLRRRPTWSATPSNKRRGGAARPPRHRSPPRGPSRARRRATCRKSRTA